MLNHANFVNGLRLSALTQTAFAPSLTHSLPILSTCPPSTPTQIENQQNRATNGTPERIHSTSGNSDHEDVDVERD